MAENARGRGFTLIELLVVIAIIALLASILMPTLQKAQEIARMSQCSNQFRHVGSAYMMYAEENNDYIISTCIGGDFPNGVYFGQAEVIRSMLMQYMSVKAKPWTFTSGVNRNNPVFCCPTASRKMDTAGSPWSIPGEPLWDSTGVSCVFGSGPAEGDGPPPQYYFYNGIPSRIYPRKFSDLPRAAETAALTDTTTYGFWSFDPVNNSVRYRHIGDRLNVLAGDSHMGTMFAAQGSSPTRPFQEWRFR